MYFFSFLQRIICVTLFIIFSSNFSQAASINGVVTNTNGELISNLSIYAYKFEDFNQQWYESDFAYIYADGEYTFDNLSSGKYRLKFGDTDFGQYSQNKGVEFYDNTQTLDKATTIELTIDQSEVINVVLGDINTGSISGVITNSDGSNPLEEASVTLEMKVNDDYWSYAGNFQTGVDGKYIFENVLEGEFRINVNKYSDGYISEYYENALTYETATPITVLEGEDVSNIDISLNRNGKLTGKITDINGNALENAIVELFSEYDGEWFNQDTDYTYNDGLYNFILSPDRLYRLKVSNSDRSAYEFYDNQTLFENSNNFSLQLNETKEIDIVLGNIQSGSISGRVTDNQNQPITFATVTVSSEETSFPYSTSFNAYTDSNGEYKLSNLIEGNYSVSFSAYDFVDETYNNVTADEVGTKLSITSGSSFENIDAQLDKKGEISGEIKNESGDFLSEVLVTLYKEREGVWDYYNGQYVYNGLYNFTNIEPGNYKLKYEYNDSYEYYNDKTTQDLATTIQVDINDEKVANAILGNINYLSVSGSIKYSDDRPITNSYLYVERNNNGRWEFVTSAFTNDLGNYLIENLESGDYRIQFDSYVGEGYIDPEPEFFTVVQNMNLLNVNLVVVKASSIEGNVKDINGSLIIYNAYITAYLLNNDGTIQSVYYAYSDENGFYSLKGLPEGSYKVSFLDFGPDASQFTNGRKNINEANVIVIGKSETLNLDFQFFKTINGFVKDEEQNSLPNVYVYAYAQTDDSYSYAGFTTTDENGYYAFTGLDNDSYTFEYYRSDNGITQYLGNSDSIDNALRVDVIATQEQALNFQFVSRVINQPESIPTLSEWSLIVLIFSLFMLSFYSTRYRKRNDS